MKKILILIIMIIVISSGVNLNAQSYDDDDSNNENSALGGGANSSDLSGGANSSQFGGGANSSDLSGGSNSNVMLGGGDSNSALGAGLNKDQGFVPGSYTYTPSSKTTGVPKLSLEGVVLWLVGIMNQLVYVIIGAALVVFLYGILRLSFVDGQKPEAREQARKFMFWGIVSLFVMVSVWGLVRIFQFTLFNSGNLIIPQLK